MDQAATVAVGTVLLGAILSGTRRAATAWRDRNREGRAAALVILVALREALIKTHAPHLHPVRPVVVPFASYAGVWQSERKALARTMTLEKFRHVDAAFAALSALQKSEELGGDLREEVFDGLWDAGMLCEKARRIAWRQTQSPRDQVQRWIDIQARSIRQRREFWKLGRAVAKARKQSNLSVPA